MDRRSEHYDPVDGEYTYFGWVREGDPSDQLSELLRHWTTPQGHHHEQRYTHDRGWVRSWIWEDVKDNRKSGWVLPVTAEAAERFKAELAVAVIAAAYLEERRQADWANPVIPPVRP
ncbi:hypothetical protein [Crossiella cryophila]|uniref:Uncharacterized protein n=1 Tax=Crossiella cryophila TaxID=43355 RepID=A0A7W7FUU8_9PSEU|nr:hypothetical protein [Crossiella cryophila]MBB4679731.1 hypothetical protein [Crossiella cryophila]